MGWGMLGKIGGGLKGLGKGIVKGIDKFDDMIKLKEIANVMQFVPGPQQAFFKPLAMTYAGFDTAKGIKNRNLGQALKGGLQMYGSSKIGTGPQIAIPKPADLFTGQAPDFSSNLSLLDKIGTNVGKFTGGMANPLNLSGGNQALYDTMAAPLVNQAIGGQQQQQQQRQGPLVQAPMQRYRPRMAQGGIANADYYSPGSAIVGEAGPEFLTPLNGLRDERAAAGILGLPPMRGGGMIPHLPSDYSGWVNGPHIATLGENGTEAVLPLDKLRTAAGGAMTYPMMQEGGILGGLKRLALPRMLPGGKATGLLAKMLGKGARFIPGVGFMYGAGAAGSDLYDLYQGKQGGKEYGWGDWGKDQISNAAWALPFGAFGGAAAYDIGRGEMDEELSELWDFLGPEEAQAQTLNRRDATDAEFGLPGSERSFGSYTGTTPEGRMGLRSIEGLTPTLPSPSPIEKGWLDPVGASQEDMQRMQDITQGSVEQPTRGYYHPTTVGEVPLSMPQRIEAAIREKELMQTQMDAPDPSIPTLPSPRRTEIGLRPTQEEMEMQEAIAHGYIDEPVGTGGTNYGEPIEPPYTADSIATEEEMQRLEDINLGYEDEPVGTGGTNYGVPLEGLRSPAPRIQDQIPIPEGIYDSELAGEMPMDIDPALLDNPNARYWLKKDPARYASMLQALREQQAAGPFQVPIDTPDPLAGLQGLPFEMPIDTPNPLAGLQDTNLPFQMPIDTPDPLAGMQDINLPQGNGLDSQYFPGQNQFLNMLQMQDKAKPDFLRSAQGENARKWMRDDPSRYLSMLLGLK